MTEVCVSHHCCIDAHEEPPVYFQNIPESELVQVERPVLGESNARHAAPLALMLQPAGAQKSAVIPSISLRDWQR